MISFIEVVVTLVTVIAISVVLFFKWSHSYWKRKNVLQIQPSIPMGNLENPLALKKGFLGVLTNAYKRIKLNGQKFGGIYLLHKPVFVPVDLDLIKNILTKDFSHFINRGNLLDEKNDPLSVNLLNLEDDKWKNLRGKLSPTFTSGKMKMMFETMIHSGDQLRNHIRLLCKQNKSLDIKEIVSCYTTDIIGSCAFGIDCNSLENPHAEFREYGRRLMTLDTITAIRFFILFVMPELNTVLKMKTIRKDVEDFFINALKDVIDHRTSTDSKRNDFIQLLLELSVTHGNSSTVALTTNEMIAQAFIFFLGGFETSAQNLSYCLYELAFNQDIQQKIRDEIGEIVKRYDAKITYDSIMEMKYMDQVVDETLRKYPPIPFLNRKCTKAYTVPGSNVTIEKDTSVIISTYNIHMDPDYYPNPEMFDPERFSKENKLKGNPFLPFGDGPRICIGMRFANMQIKIALASILSDFKIVPNESTVRTIVYDPKALIMMPLHPIILSAESI